MLSNGKSVLWTFPDPVNTLTSFAEPVLEAIFRFQSACDQVKTRSTCIIAYSLIAIVLSRLVSRHASIISIAKYQDVELHPAHGYTLENAISEILNYRLPISEPENLRGRAQDAKLQDPSDCSCKV